MSSRPLALACSSLGGELALTLSTKFVTFEALDLTEGNADQHAVFRGRAVCTGTVEAALYTLDSSNIFSPESTGFHSRSAIARL